MSISKNIYFDSKAIKLSDFEFHTSQLQIASWNLDDFNKRLGSNILLNYDHINSIFTQISIDELYGKVFLNSLDNYLKFHKDNNETWTVDRFISKEMSQISDWMETLKYKILLKKSNFNGNEDDLDSLNLFLKRYKDYSPIGIFDIYKIKDYKEELSKIYKELTEVLHLLN